MVQIVMVKKSHSEEWLFFERPKITSFLQQQVQQVQQMQQVQRLEIQQQEQQVQQLELQQQVLVQEQRLLLFCRKQPEPKPAGKRSATIFS